MDRAARLLRGMLRVRVESAFPERVLNLCGAHGIAFSDLRWESASALSFTVRAAERKKLERLLVPLDAALTVERAAGAPFFLRRFRRRYTLLAGLALMLALFFANSFFIWDFEVSGSETVPAEKILRVLEKQGLRRGSFAYSFRPQDILQPRPAGAARACVADGQRPRLPRLRQRARPRAQARAGGRPHAHERRREARRPRHRGARLRRQGNGEEGRHRHGGSAPHFRRGADRRAGAPERSEPPARRARARSGAGRGMSFRSGPRCNMRKSGTPMTKSTALRCSWAKDG